MNYLDSASVDVTYQCNLRCRHCFDFGGECKRQEMDDREVLNVFYQLAQANLSSICICGGEPLLRRGLVNKAISLIKKNDKSTLVSMVSNGLLWTERIASELKESGLDLIQFSLDGITNESYDYVRMSHGQLPQVIKAIRIATDNDIKVAIASLPHSRNIEEYPKIIDFCESLGISDFRAQPLMPLGRGERNYNELCLTPEQNDALAKYMSSRNATSPMQITWGDPVDHLFMYQETGRIPQVCINAFGEISVSPYLPITIWNLRKRPLQEYIDLEIDIYALQHPVVLNRLQSISGLSDFTSNAEGLPILFLESSLDISEELREVARERKTR